MDEKDPMLTVPDGGAAEPIKASSSPAKGAGMATPKMIGMGALLIVAATLLIVLPLTLTNRDNTSSNGSSSDKDVLIPVETSSPTNTTGGTSTTGDENPNNNPNNNNIFNHSDSTVTAAPSSLWEDNGTTTSSNNSNDNNNNTTAEDTIGKDGLPFFGKGITRGYQTPLELEAALAIALTRDAQSYAQQQLVTYQQYVNNNNNYGSDTVDYLPIGTNATDAMGSTDAQVPMPPPTAAGAQAEQGSVAASSLVAEDAGGDAGRETAGAGDTTTDYATNNQEFNVDEADVIKADAKYVYAAFGNYVVVWNLQGEIVAQIKMPDIELPENWGQPPEGQPMPMPLEAAVAKQATQEGVEQEINVAKQDIEALPPAEDIAASQPYYVWKPKPQIQSMLLTDNHLVAIVTGYNDNYYNTYGYYNDPAQQGNASSSKIEPHVLSNYLSTQIRLYEISEATGNLTFVAQKDVHGYFVDARSMEGVVHLATASSVDLYTHLWQYMDPWQFPPNMTLEEYQNYAAEVAAKVVPQLAQKLTQELQAVSPDGTLPQMLQVNEWMTATPPEEEDEDSAATTDATSAGRPTMDTFMMMPEYRVINNAALVTSFHVQNAVTTDGTNQEKDLVISSSAYLAPSYFSTLYGTTDKLVLATSGWDWAPWRGSSEPTTYLVALKANNEDASTEFLSVGQLKGHLLNPYALDIVGEELRAATTIDLNQWGWGGGPIMMMEDVAVGMPLAMAKQGSGAECPPADSECMDKVNYETCVLLLEQGCLDLSIMESCPLQFDCLMWDADDTAAETMPPQEDETKPPQDDASLIQEPILPPEEPTSRTENYMIVMNLVSDVEGQMSEKGKAQVGLPNERITAVRFFDKIAYVVTFEQTDPFYVVNMTGVDGPTVLGELKLPGFSSYLHSMNEDNTMLVAVGQNASQDGRTTGLMVTVFDATDPTAPKTLASHVFGDSTEGAYTSSNVQWDYKSFRLVNSNKLIVPLDVWYNQEWDPVTQDVVPLPEGVENFQGFAVLDVWPDEISESFRVSHMNTDPGGCYCGGGYVPTRSFVYSGDLMTVRDNTVVSTNLDSGKEVWRMKLKVEDDAEDCGCY